MVKLRYTRRVFLVPYIITFLLIGFVGLQLMGASSADPLITDGVTLTTSKRSYAVGENVRFIIDNQTTAAVSVTNNCPDVPLNVYRQEAGKWQQLHESTDEAKCFNAPRSFEIASKAQVSASYIYWPGLFSQPGHYRLEALLEQSSASLTTEFDVVNK